MAVGPPGTGGGGKGGNGARRRRGGRGRGPGRVRRGAAGALDRAVIVRAAALAVAVTLPPTLVVRVLRGSDDEQRSYLWVIAVVALFAGFALAGRQAARRRPDAPLVHAIAAAALAFAVLAAIAVVRRLVTGDGISAALVITLGLLLQITVSVSVLAAYVDLRSRARAAR